MTPYDFNDVLEIYGVDSPWKIKSADHHFINYSEGTITDKDDIKTLYDVIDENIQVLKLPTPNWVEKTNENENILKWNNLTKNNYILQ